MIWTTIFQQTFSSNFFSVLLGCFFDTLTFSVKRQKKLFKLQNRWTSIFFYKNTFPQKMPLDARITVVTTREKIFRLRVFWIKVQRRVKDYKKISRNVFPQKLPRIPRLRVSQIWRNFSQEKGKFRSESEKIANFPLLKNFFP